MKKYVITGSLGHISKPIAQQLVKAGKEVFVITISSEKEQAIKEIGAHALIGSVEDVDFLRQAFKGAYVVYTMIPTLTNTDNIKASQNKVANNYTEAVSSNNIKYVVNLSSVGAHLGVGCGPVDALHDFEQSLNKIEGLNVKHLRPSYFYYNLFGQIGLIKHAGIAGGNFGTEGQKNAFVHTDDIAAAAIEELLNLNFKGSSVRYIASDIRSMQEVAEVLGQSVGKSIPWVVFTDDQQKEGLINAGLEQSYASALSEMGVALRTGKMLEDFFNNKPSLSPTKLEDFAKEFSKAFNA